MSVTQTGKLIDKTGIKQKSRPHWDGRHSRGTTHIDQNLVHSLPTIIGMPVNAGTAV